MHDVNQFRSKFAVSDVEFVLLIRSHVVIFYNNKKTLNFYGCRKNKPALYYLEMSLRRKSH